MVWNSTRSLFDPEPDERLDAMSILEFVLQFQPHNPAANHYWIHGWEDTSYPEIALPHAKILPVYAARSPHLAHMPGHVYHRVGNYNTAANEFKDASYVDLDYMISQVCELFLQCWKANRITLGNHRPISLAICT